VGERWPFVKCPFTSPLPFGCRGDGFAVADGVVVLAGVRPLIFRTRIGLLLFDLARLNSALVSSSSSISSSIGASETACFFLADLVTGPKYPSCDASRLSEGVGEGEITLGVAGMGFEDDRDMVKGGREGIRMAPVTRRPIAATRRIQEVELKLEWRCLSLREARIVTAGREEEDAIGSSGEGGAEQDCAASLGGDMVTFFAPIMWHTEGEVVVLNDEGLTSAAINILLAYF